MPPAEGEEHEEDDEGPRLAAAPEEPGWDGAFDMIYRIMAIKQFNIGRAAKSAFFFNLRMRQIWRRGNSGPLWWRFSSSRIDSFEQFDSSATRTVQFDAYKNGSDLLCESAQLIRWKESSQKKDSFLVVGEWSQR